ncbi:MAG: ATP-dependent helicase [Candidatus Natronoplasma sp.]
MSIEVVDESRAREDLPEEFEPYVKRWFQDRFDRLTPPQKYSFEMIHEGKNSLVCSPTGSGKTLSAFLSILNELFLKGDEGELEDKVYCLYVSPLRALGNDIQRNLEKPLDGIKEIAEDMDIEMPEVRSAVRTGDTPSQERQKMLKKPPHILVTTPETLGIILNAPKFKEKLKDISYVIVDEIHSLCDNKRGAHLSLSLERLEAMCSEEPTRIGLSATQAPIKEIAKYLVGYEDGGPRQCDIVDVSASKDLDLKVISPVEDLIHTSGKVVNDKMYKRIDELVKDHITTLIFTNTRSATERVVNNLTNRDPEFYEGNIGAHHSSMSRDKRIGVEESLKNGELKVVVTSTSLELGIDIGYIDLVLQLSSPKGVSRAIQRIGRSGHGFTDDPKGRVLVMERGDALECTEMMRCAKENELDRVRIPKNCLDVLSQHIVGMGCNRKWGVEEAYEVIKRSFNFHSLGRKDYEKTLRYVAGEYASLEDQKVYGKIWLDEDEKGEKEFGRRGKLTRVIYMTNIGTIPDESAYRVHTRDGRFVGTLDEDFLDRLTKGDIFIHGGDTYEFRYARGMKVYVDARPDRAPTVPSWFSEMLPLSYDLGRKIGEFNKKVRDMIEEGEDPSGWIRENYYVDEKTISSIISYLDEQYRYVKAVPTDSTLLVEKNFEGEKINLIFHTIFGRKVNDALCRVFADHTSDMLNANVGIVVDDHGFVLICPDKKIDVDDLIQRVVKSDMRKTLKQAVRKTELMKRRFRHVASRALMILRNYKGNKLSVGKQQMKSHFLLSACERIDEDFPIVKETYREIIEDYMDIENASDIIKRVEEGKMDHRVIETEVPSPFAHNLVIQSQSDVLKLDDKKERLQALHKKVMESIGRTEISS